MKNFIAFLALVFTTSVGFSQKEKDVKLNEETNLLEATYYHDNGVVSQEGTFDLEGKLHGKWLSFDAAGEKVSMGNYEKGVRTGKWKFWSDKGVKEVEFSDNVIASITDTDDSSGVVIKD